MHLQYKKEQIMFDTNDLKPELSGKLSAFPPPHMTG